jgi:hypothetical protein
LIKIFANALESFWRLMAGQGPVYPAAKKLNRLAFRAGTPFLFFRLFLLLLSFFERNKRAPKGKVNQMRETNQPASQPTNPKVNRFIFFGSRNRPRSTFE